MHLICAFVFAYAKSRFSHDMAHYVWIGFRKMLFIGLNELCVDQYIYVLFLTL